MPNWDKIEPFVGHPIPQAGTPEFATFKKAVEDAGYRLDPPTATKNYRLVRPVGKADWIHYAPLTVTGAGDVAVQTGAGSRISLFSRYRTNYLKYVEREGGPAARGAAEAHLASGSQLHHRIPDGVAQRSPLVRATLERLKGYTIDRGTNILDMPNVRRPKPNMT